MLLQDIISDAVSRSTRSDTIIAPTSEVRAVAIFIIIDNSELKYKGGCQIYC